jgi:methyl-accepting chemotaxis protein
MRHEEQEMRESQSTIGTVLADFRNVTEALVESSARMKQESLGIKAEVAEALVQLQFQDRVSQIMSHVRHNIEMLPELLEDNQRQCVAGGALVPLQPKGLLDELEKTYAMAEEHAVHGGGGGAVAQPEITFF